MALKDIRWQVTGNVKIDDITLKNPIVEIDSFYYKPKTRKVQIELGSVEDVTTFRHSRLFEFDVPGIGNEQFTVANIKAFVESKFPNFVAI